MSLSSLTSNNRLLHITDLPNSKKYSENDINILLPIHYKTLKENVLAVVHFESFSKKFKHKLFVHDKNLFLNSSNYSQIKGGWCDDLDNSTDRSN